MGEQKPKQVVEWSFSFGDVGDSINKTLKQLGADAEIKESHFSEPVGTTKTARIRLDLATGKMVVRALTNSENLIEADVRHIGEMEFSVSGESDKVVRLGQKNNGVIAGPIKDFLNTLSNHDELRWEIGLAANIPLDLEIHGGVGQSKLDLSGLQIRHLKLGSGVGEVHLDLPAMPEPYSVEIDGGVGETSVTIAEGAAVRLRASGGVGSVKLRLPESSAARIEVQGGLGGAKMAPRFTRVKAGSDFISPSGTWETPGYALAAHQIVVHFSGGVGELKVS
ncbi:MAG: hypothetical protein ABI690_00780 [Chloroflexota bacterium]